MHTMTDELTEARTDPRPATAPAALQRLFGDDIAAWMPGGVCPFPLMRLAPDTTLIHEGSSARLVHVIQAGHFKILRTCEDGYEQVLDFADTGDLLGCDSLADGRHASGAVALEESWVFALPIQDVHRMCADLPAVALRWQAAMAGQITRAGDRAWVMGAVGAEKRVTRFLLLNLQRQAARGESSRRLRLRMCRRDLASHLGLSHESVSRSFTLLTETGMLRVDNREIELCDPSALQALAYSTRGYPALRRQASERSSNPSSMTAALLCPGA